MAAVLRAIRGATTVDIDTAEQVRTRTQALVGAMLEANDVANEDLVSIIFTVTADVTSAFPATAARELGLDDVPLLGATEATVAGATERCIRVLMHCYSERSRKEIQHEYREGAIGLRTDLAR
jgi:chorismate mutase